MMKVNEKITRNYQIVLDVEVTEQRSATARDLVMILERQLAQLARYLSENAVYGIKYVDLNSFVTVSQKV